MPSKRTKKNTTRPVAHVDERSAEERAEATERAAAVLAGKVGACGRTSYGPMREPLRLADGGRDLATLLASAGGAL